MRDSTEDPKLNFVRDIENLPLTTHVYELKAIERVCPCCGVERNEIGADESWLVE